MKTGTADLPLHPGRAPRWLFERMVRLSGAVSEAIIDEYGKEELLRRLSDPYWFQAFACVLGFDWHSSGVTTTACGALKLAGLEEHGIKVAGGKGKTSRKAPAEIEGAFSLTDKKIAELKYASRMAAKVDNSCVQDGYQLYHHCMIFTERGDWAVVQQGMSEPYARRYHWLGDDVSGFVDEPHSGIACDRREERVLDLTAGDSRETRRASVDLVRDNPERLRRYLGGQRTLSDYLHMPEHHPVLGIDITEAGWQSLRRAWEFQPRNYEELVSLSGIGPQKLRALALISELIYGTRPSWRDPAKYSFTHGGKDGVPYAVDRTTYDHSIRHLRDALESAEIGREEKIAALKRLKDFI